MIDSFPYESWLNEAGDGFNTDITTFWTFGPAGGAEGGSLTGTYVLTALGMLVMVGLADRLGLDGEAPARTAGCLPTRRLGPGELGRGEACFARSRSSSQRSRARSSG